MTLVLCRRSNWLGFSVGIEIDVFLCGGGETYSVFVCAANMTCFKRGDRLTWFSCSWSKLTWFWYFSRKGLGLCVRIEVELFCAGVIEIDIDSLLGTKLDFVQCRVWN